MKKIITICAFAACLTGCDDLFEPAIENNLGLEYMYRIRNMPKEYWQMPIHAYPAQAILSTTWLPMTL